jgi:Family of unknown function (DUF6493)
VRLARDGKIPHDRLRDAALDGLSRDMHDFRARWFVAFHHRLEPTPLERSSRGARYVDLLGSRNPSTVDFALKVIKELVKAGRLDPGGLVDRLTPAFHARTKGSLRKALSVLDLVVGRSGDAVIKTRASLIAAEGLLRDAADVQAAILDFIERHGDPAEKPLHDLLASRLDAIAVWLRSRLEMWLEVQEASSREPALDDPEELIARARVIDERLARLAGIPEALAALRGECSDAPALTFDGTEIPRLDPSRELEPIDDPDTLIELCSRLVENPAPFEDVDGCVDAVSRMCDRRPIDFFKRTAPLETRLQQRLAERHDPSESRLRSFAVIFRSWLTGQVPSAPPFDRSWALDSFISAWVFGLARRVARAEAAPLLSAPTHSGGWIDPRELVARYRERCSLPIANEPADLILALLRLAPDHRPAALADAADLEGERGAAIRHALGAGRWYALDAGGADGFVPLHAVVLHERVAEPGVALADRARIDLRNRRATVGRGERRFFRLAGHARNLAQAPRPGRSHAADGAAGPGRRPEREAARDIRTGDRCDHRRHRRRPARWREPGRVAGHCLAFPNPDVDESSLPGTSWHARERGQDRQGHRGAAGSGGGAGRPCAVEREDDGSRDQSRTGRSVGGVGRMF